MIRSLTMIAVFLPFILMGQTQTGQTQTGAKKSNVPRTPDGHPDLSGIWTNITVTTLERPDDVGNKQYFTPAEAAAYEKHRVETQDADRPENRKASDPGNYNQAFWDRGTRVVNSLRTSLLIDPPDGKMPPMTPEAKAKVEALAAKNKVNPSDGPEDRRLSERCIWFAGDGPPYFPEPYNNNYQIAQTPGYVTILAEMNHEVRTIPIDPPGAIRPHLPPSVLQWQGDSRGHWEGDTLVVDSTNFKPTVQSRYGVTYMAGFNSEKLHVIERFTRDSPTSIDYRATVDDPGVYTKPWTVELFLNQTKGPLYEFACHEGNYSMLGILQGAREEEKKAAAGH